MINHISLKLKRAWIATVPSGADKGGEGVFV